MGSTGGRRAGRDAVARDPGAHRRRASDRAARGRGDDGADLRRADRGRRAHRGLTVAAALIAADLALQRGVARWHGTGAPPAAVVQAAEMEQRIELRMARDPRLERGVLAKLPRALARDVADDVAARRDLLLLAPHKPGPPVRLGPALPVAELGAYYREGQRRTGVPWQLLAAVNFVESDFGRLREASS